MRKAIGMFAALMVALAMTGVGVAHWEKLVTVEGTVTTGTLHLRPSIEVELRQDKPVATLEYGVDVEKNKAWIEVNNAYPCLWVTGYLNIVNDGSIPAGLARLTCETEPDLEFVWNEEEECYDVYQAGIEKPIANLYITTVGCLEQIDPGKYWRVAFDLHFKEDLPQNAKYTFEITFEFWNWNEVANNEE